MHNTDETSLAPHAEVWICAQKGDGEELWFYDQLPAKVVRRIEEFNGEYYEILLEEGARLFAHRGSLSTEAPP